MTYYILKYKEPKHRQSNYFLVDEKGGKSLDVSSRSVEGLLEKMVEMGFNESDLSAQVPEVVLSKVRDKYAGPSFICCIDPSLLAFSKSFK